MSVLLAAVICISCYFPPPSLYEDGAPAAESIGPPPYYVGDRVMLRTDLRKRGIIVDRLGYAYTIEWNDGTTTVQGYDELLLMKGRP